MQTRQAFHGPAIALVAGLILALGIAGPAAAAPRTVLGELFSSAG